MNESINTSLIISPEKIPKTPTKSDFEFTIIQSSTPVRPKRLTFTSPTIHRGSLTPRRNPIPLCEECGLFGCQHYFPSNISERSINVQINNKFVTTEGCSPLPYRPPNPLVDEGLISPRYAAYLPFFSSPPQNKGTRKIKRATRYKGEIIDKSIDLLFCTFPANTQLREKKEPPKAEKGNIKHIQDGR